MNQAQSVDLKGPAWGSVVCGLLGFAVPFIVPGIVGCWLGMQVTHSRSPAGTKRIATIGILLNTLQLLLIVLALLVWAPKYMGQ